MAAHGDTFNISNPPELHSTKLQSQTCFPRKRDCSWTSSPNRYLSKKKYLVVLSTVL